MSRETNYQRLRIRSRGCPRCGAVPMEPCTNKAKDTFHLERWRSAGEKRKGVWK